MRLSFYPITDVTKSMAKRYGNPFWVYTYLMQISLFIMQIFAFKIQISVFKCNCLYLNMYLNAAVSI